MTTNKYYTLVVDEYNYPRIKSRNQILEDILNRLDDLDRKIQSLHTSVDFSFDHSLEVILDSLNEKKDYHPITDDNPHIQF